MSTSLDMDAGGRTGDTAEVEVPVGNREVRVWVRDVNKMKYSANVPISSTFDDVMHKVRERHGYFQGNAVVGFKGGPPAHREQKARGWDERSTVAQLLTGKPTNVNEEDYLFQHPIQPKFKRECLIL